MEVASAAVVLISVIGILGWIGYFVQVGLWKVSHKKWEFFSDRYFRLLEKANRYMPAEEVEREMEIVSKENNPNQED